MQPIIKRFLEQIDRRGDDECWLWKGKTNRDGYGRFWPGGVHRISYELENGEIPENLVIDHLCRVRSCVNPKHLEAVTNKTNVLRGVSPIAKNAKKTSCKNGHPYDGVEGRGRICVTCHKEYKKNYYEKNGEKIRAQTIARTANLTEEEWEQRKNYYHEYYEEHPEKFVSARVPQKFCPCGEPLKDGRQERCPPCRKAHHKEYHQNYYQAQKDATI